MKALLITLWVFICLVGIAWGALPFILAAKIGLSWINWFGIMTVPSGIMTIVGSLLQAKVLFGRDSLL